MAKDLVGLGALLLGLFRLDGEDVVRIRTGRVVGTLVPTEKTPYTNVEYRGLDGSRQAIGYHRLKYFLHTGVLPTRVDHRDRDTANNLLSNLRAATPAQNGANNKGRGRELPTGVYRIGVKYTASVWCGDGLLNLGAFRTAEAASTAASRLRKALHGEFYAGGE